MREHVLLTGVSRSERQGVIASATEAIGGAGGWVEDVHFFSNLAVNLRCVVLPPAVARLGEALTKLGIGLTAADTEALRRAAAQLTVDEEVRFSLQITFVHQEPPLRRHVPSVPG